MFQTPFATGRKVPLKEWERQDKVNLEGGTYGWEEKRCTIRFYLPMERDKQRLHEITRDLVRDVKYSRNWRCEFCAGRRRSSRDPDDDAHLDAPVPADGDLVIYIHICDCDRPRCDCDRPRCDCDRPRCFAGVEEHHQMINVLNGLPPNPLQKPLRLRPGNKYPLAGSCAGCQKDSAAGMELQRCSRCKLTRYCSTKCQHDDWKRHKATCSQIYSVLFEGWD